MSAPTGPNPESRSRPTTKLEKPRFLVAIEFASREAAVDHMVALLSTGWPRGPKEKDLKLIVIGREGDEGDFEGVELGASQLNQVEKAIAQLSEHTHP